MCWNEGKASSSALPVGAVHLEACNNLVGVMVASTCVMVLESVSESTAQSRASMTALIDCASLLRRFCLLSQSYSTPKITTRPCISTPSRVAAGAMVVEAIGFLRQLTAQV